MPSSFHMETWIVYCSWSLSLEILLPGMDMNLPEIPGLAEDAFYWMLINFPLKHVHTSDASCLFHFQQIFQFFMPVTFILLAR